MVDRESSARLFKLARGSYWGMLAVPVVILPLGWWITDTLEGVPAHLDPRAANVVLAVFGALAVLALAVLARLKTVWRHQNPAQRTPDERIVLTKLYTRQRIEHALWTVPTVAAFAGTRVGAPFLALLAAASLSTIGVLLSCPRWEVWETVADDIDRLLGAGGTA